MHRTQISLEDSQYVALLERARRSHKSMGQLIRDLLDREFTSRAEASLREQEGLYALGGALKDRGTTARDHDEALYGGRG